MRLFALILSLCFAGSAHAQMLQSIVNAKVGAAPTGYQGLYEASGNQAATGYGGLRCFSASQANATQAVKVRRASDNATQDVGLTSACAFDIASANTFAGTDATCTGSMTGTTTLTISTCASGTPHVQDTITGAGIVQPAYITVIGGCATPPGTCTVNKAQTFSSETVTAQVAMYVAEVYDQTGHGNHWTQATTAQQPQLLPSDTNGLPTVLFPDGASLQTASITQTQPMTFYAVAARLDLFTTAQEIIFSLNNTQLSFASSTNGIIEYGGTVLTAAQTDGATHIFQGVLNGASSLINTDNVGNPIAGAAAGSTGMSGTVTIGANNLGAEYLAGTMTEWAIEPVALSNAAQTSVCHNAHLAWGTGTSC